MLFYQRILGEWSRGDERELLFGGCYSGMDVGKNNIAMQMVHNVGPLPAGVYGMTLMQLRPHLGPSIALTPHPENEMFGRSEFLVHLDNPAHVGFSSDGCIVCQNEPDVTGMAKLQKLNALIAAGENVVTVE